MKKNKKMLLGQLMVSTFALFVISVSFGCSPSSSGGGGGTNQSAAVSASLNESIQAQFATQGGTQIPGNTPVDNNIVLDAPPSGVMPFTPGMSANPAITFSAPAGTLVTGIGIRFGDTGPINVLPLTPARLHSRQVGVGFAHHLRKQAQEKKRRSGVDWITIDDTAAVWNPEESSNVIQLTGTGSDSCNAIAASDNISGFGAFPASTASATNGTLQTNCGAADSVKDIWFRWTSPVSGSVTMSTCGTLDQTMDSVITLWANAAGCPTTQIGCDDDSCASGNWDAALTFTAQAGSQYLIQISNYWPLGTQGHPAWSGSLTISSNGGGGGGGSSSGTGSVSFTVPQNICANLSSICHQIICYEYAVTSAGTISRGNIMQVAMQCGNCSEPSCQQLIQGCSGGGSSPYQGTWAGGYSGNCGGNCIPPVVSGGWTFTVSATGAINGSVDGDPITGSISPTGAAAAGTAGGATWSGQISGTSITGTWTDPDCPCNGSFSGNRQ
jgi:hypothetical protein